MVGLVFNGLNFMIESKIKVTICVPLFNVEKFIVRCANSLLNQSYNNIEYIFVDDCSPDNSVALLKTVLKLYPQRERSIKIISHAKNRGLAAARNTAVLNSTGDFILHVDSDDFVDSRVVEKLVAKQILESSDIVTCDSVFLFTGHKKYVTHLEEKSPRNLIHDVLKKKTQVHIWGRLIRTSLYRENDIKALEGCDMAEDFQVLPRLLYFSQKISFIHEYLYFYECTNSNSYTSCFSERYSLQAQKSIDVVRDFFSNKDLEYMDSVMVSYLNLFVRNKINCIKDNRLDSFFLNNEKSIRDIDKKHVKDLNLQLKFAYYVKSDKLILYAARFYSILKKICLAL